MQNHLTKCSKSIGNIYIFRNMVKEASVLNIKEFGVVKACTGFKSVKYTFAQGHQSNKTKVVISTVCKKTKNHVQR